MYLNHDLVTKAVSSLLTHAEKKEENTNATNLLDTGVESMQMIVTVKKISAKMRKMPYRLPLRQRLYEEPCSVCLIIKNHDEEHVEKLKNLGISVIKEIVSAKDMKTKYHSFEARRALLKAHDLFLTDDRIINSLPKILGGKFYQKNKLPGSVNLKAKDLKKSIEDALRCTYFRAARGTCNAIWVGTTDMPAKRLVENVEDALEALVKHIPNNWDNIQTVGIKTGSSLMLPVYNALPEAAKSIKSKNAEEENKDEDMADDKEKKSKKEKRKSKNDSTEPKKKSRKSPLSREKSEKLVKAHAENRAKAVSA
ncbi:ribosomal protein L1p/L10e family-domain-containing protein [Coemansia mojavensis]|nr:ribosomal protein L1p/L10e family-domain-containing protein [Coemansia mojavensis]KAJ2653536.1 proteasome-interacting protein cic1 [Coemansia sp. RSA 1250]